MRPMPKPMNQATNRNEAAFTFWNWRSTVTHSGISRVVCANTCAHKRVSGAQGGLPRPAAAYPGLPRTTPVSAAPYLGLFEHGLARRGRAGVQPRQLQLLRQLLLQLLLVRGLGGRGRRRRLHAHELVLEPYLQQAATRVSRRSQCG